MGVAMPGSPAFLAGGAGVGLLLGGCEGPLPRGGPPRPRDALPPLPRDGAAPSSGAGAAALLGAAATATDFSPAATVSIFASSFAVASVPAFAAMAPACSTIAETSRFLSMASSSALRTAASGIWARDRAAVRRTAASLSFNSAVRMGTTLGSLTSPSAAAAL